MILGSTKKPSRRKLHFFREGFYYLQQKLGHYRFLHVRKDLAIQAAGQSDCGAQRKERKIAKENIWHMPRLSCFVVTDAYAKRVLHTILY